MSEQAKPWSLEGRYFENCSCEVLCPCIVKGMQTQPTEGRCDVVLGVAVAKGTYGSVDISGLNVVQALTTPGPMGEGNGTLAVYVDRRANPEQRAALEAIFTGAAGGPPALLASLTPNRMPTKVADIEFKVEGNQWKLSMPGIADVTVEGVVGAGGSVMWLDNAPHPYSQRLAIAKSVGTSRYNDHSMAFVNDGRNGHFAPVNWSNS